MKLPLEQQLRALEASEARCRAILENNADGMVIVGRDGIVRFVNPAAESLLGRPSSELVGATFGIPLVPGETTEVDIIRSDRSHVVAEMRAVETTWGEETVSLASLRDVSARKRAEADLRESEERYRLLVEGAKDHAIFMLGVDGRVASWNTGAQRVLGYVEEEILGADFACFYTADDARNGVPERELALAQLAGSASDERWLVRKDGTPFWAAGTTTPLRDEAGALRGFAKVLRDSTERKGMLEQLECRAAELLDADRRKDEYLATLAHELRNPLAPMRNALYLLRDAQEPAAREEVRAMMERQLTHMVRLIDDLLDVSRITRGKVELRKERVELGSMVQISLETSRPFIEAGCHELTVTLPDGPTYVDVDPTRFSQVLSNLLNNAAKFTPPGGRIELLAEHDSSHIVVRVRDWGIGIPREMLPRIFDMFIQVDRSLERTQGGLGIGLTLVKRLVELHGGTVEARSEGRDQGSEFIVRMPASERHCGSDGRHSGGAAAHDRECRGRRILIADDNVDAAVSLGKILQSLGSEICTTHDGIEAVKAAAVFRPEVILLDIGMPRLNGYDAARRIRQQPWGQSVIIIALTGWGHDDDRRRARDAGFDHHLVKPVDLSLLESLVIDPGSLPGGCAPRVDGQR